MLIESKNYNIRYSPYFKNKKATGLQLMEMFSDF